MKAETVFNVFFYIFTFLAVYVQVFFLYTFFMTQNIDTDALMKEIEELYMRYGSEDFSIAKRAYEYAKKSHT